MLSRMEGGGTQVSKQNAYKLAEKRTRLGRGPSVYNASFYLLMRPRTGSWIDDSISVIYSREKVILINYGQYVQRTLVFSKKQIRTNHPRGYSIARLRCHKNGKS